MTFHRLNTLARDRGPLDLLKAPNYYLPNFLEAVCYQDICEYNSHPSHSRLCGDPRPASKCLNPSNCLNPSIAWYTSECTFVSYSTRKVI